MYTLDSSRRQKSIPSLDFKAYVCVMVWHVHIHMYLLTVYMYNYVDSKLQSSCSVMCIFLTGTGSGSNKVAVGVGVGVGIVAILLLVAAIIAVVLYIVPQYRKESKSDNKSPNKIWYRNQKSQEVPLTRDEFFSNKHRTGTGNDSNRLSVATGDIELELDTQLNSEHAQVKLHGVEDNGTI